MAVLFSSVATEAQLLHSKSKTKKREPAAAADNSAAPDKILYDRALIDIKKGRHEVGRLNLQTLINTYPDSEYLAKAKLSIADSYYKESGSANLTQAIAGYKDFIVFFPFLPEAPYAQIQVAMTHYKQMEKPDRDRTEAHAAEEEFQTFLAKYPKDPLVPKAEQHLREVQEVLAEGDYRIGYYYYVKGDRRASAGRLLSVTKRYPYYSRSDQALWMLGDIFEKSEKKEIASVYYSRIVRDYPLSPLVGDAKGKLVAFHVPVPQPDPKALAWMQAEASAPRPKETLIKKPMALVHNGPGHEKIVASRYGTPTMEPDSNSVSVADILTGGGKTQLGAGGSNGTTGNTAVVEIATPGTGASGGSTVEAGDTGSGTAPAASGDTTSAAPAGDNSPAAGTDGAAPNAAGTDANGAATQPNGASPVATTSDATAADASAKLADSTASDPKQESTSKKKKGLRKVIPW
jgi:outer membrane protein assembly factor BamD